MMEFADLLPSLDDPLTGPHWRALRDERVLVQRCSACGYLRWAPEPVCPECLTDGGIWTEIPGCGSLWSFTTYHRAMSPAFRDRVPYSVGLIELDAGVRMLGTLRVREEVLRIGMRLRARFAAASPEVTLLEWEAA